MSKSKTKNRKSIQELSLIDDFLFAEAMLNKETAELMTIWILSYDPFGKSMMMYHVKNIVEEIPEMNYNDGVRKIFLYTDGENGGSEEMRKLLLYMKQSRLENVTDKRLEKLHQGVEGIRSNSMIGVKYMQMWEIIDMEVLNKWLKLSARVNTIDEFIEQIKL